MKNNKQSILALAMILFTIHCYAQNVAINEDGSLPNVNAILDIKSANKGILIPRITTTARLTIPNTAGLLVYDTTAAAFFYNDGQGWKNLATSNTAGAAWSLTGNSDAAANNFLGTVNDVPLKIKVNNQSSGQINNATGNTFWGYLSGIVVTPNGASGINNTGIGWGSLSANTGGSFNTASGFQALTTNTSGTNNVANGYSALKNNTYGNGNAAVGASALLNNTSGFSNTAVGSNTTLNNTIGAENTAIGSQALLSNTLGSDNTAVGVRSLSGNTTGSFNTAIGTETSFSGSDFQNSTAIGSGATINASNKVRIGNSAVTRIEGAVSFTTPSDGRFKFKVKDDVKGLDFILQLRPVTYQFDVKRFDEQDRIINKVAGANTRMNDLLQQSYTTAASIRRSGFIAQEVEKAALTSGYNFSGIIKPQNEQDHYSLSYESFVVPLVKAVQEQQKMIVDLQKQIDALKQRLAK